MTTIAVRVPDALKEKMDRFNDVNWSAVARNAIERQIRNLELFRKFTKNSELTEEDAVGLGRELNKRLARHYQKTK